MASTSELNKHSSLENISSKERFKLTIPYITISGPSGTGKTETGKLLVERLNIPPGNFIKTGDLFRKEIKTRGHTVSGFTEREIGLDEELDKKQTKFMQEATTENPTIIEGRLAGVIHKELQQDKESREIMIPHGISLLFICDQVEREGRIFKREGKKGRPQADIIQANFERDTKDFDHWRLMHPMLDGKTIEDLYEAKRDTEGNLYNELYDFVIDTTHGSIHEVTNKIIELLSNHDFVKGGEA